MSKPIPDPRIAAYVAELSTNSVVSYSHLTLHRLNVEHGAALVQSLLDAHWKALREYDAQQRTSDRYLTDPVGTQAGLDAFRATRSAQVNPL